MALIFVRHGQAVDETEVVSNWKATSQQPWNPPLSPVGQQEVTSLCSELDDHRRKFGVPHLKRIFASPFQSCIETAAAIGQEVGLARVCVDPSLASVFDEAFYRSWAVPGCCVAQNPTEEVRAEALVEAANLVPCDWSRHPQWAPPSVDVSYEQVLRPNMLHYKWGNFEGPTQLMERLYRFFSFLTHAFSDETVLVVSHTSVLKTFLERECPTFRMNTNRCCGLYLRHQTGVQNGFRWRALGLVSPGCVPVELNMALTRQDWTAVITDHEREASRSDSETKPAAPEVPRKQYTANEALELLQKMKDDKETVARIMEQWTETQKQAGAKAKPEEKTQAVPKEEPAAAVEEREEEVDESTGRDVAEGRPAKASSFDDEEYGAECAVDGNPETRWLSIPEGNQWLMVNLGRTFQLARIEVDWEEHHYPESYLVQGGADGVNWITLAFQPGSPGKVVTTLTSIACARWVRIVAQTPAEEDGFSIRHLKVFNCERTLSTSLDAEPVLVTVRTIAGDHVRLEARPGELVASLSRRVAEELGWGTSVAKLATGDKVLEMTAAVPVDVTDLVAVREPRATRALSGSVDGTLQLCNVETGDALCTLQGHRAVVTCVTADFIQKRAISGSRDRTLRAWNLETGQVLMVFEAHEGGVNCVAADFTAKLALSGSDDKTLRLWDLDACEEVRTMCQSGEVSCLAVDFACGRALTGGQDGWVRLWDLDRGEALWEQQGHRLGASCLAADFQRQQAVSGGEDKALRLWDLQLGSAGPALQGHTSFVRCVEADFALRRALSGGADATLRLWDLDKEVILLTIRTSAGWVWCLAVNFQEQRALSGSARENTLRMWDLRSGDPVSAASPALGTQGVRCVVTNFA